MTAAPGSDRSRQLRRGLQVVHDVTHYQSEPAAGDASGAVLVLPELFGLSPHVTAVCDRLAADGYRAVAPDPYHRTPGATVLPEDTAGRDQGFRLLAALTEDDVIGDVERAIGAATSDGLSLAGLLGLSVGGYLGFLAATTLAVPVAALLYPGWLDTINTPLASSTPALPRLPHARGRILILIGEDDHLIDRASQEHIATAMTASGRGELVTYPGVGHGYLAPTRASHNPTAAADSWQRTLTHLR